MQRAPFLLLALLLQSACTIPAPREAISSPTADETDAAFVASERTVDAFTGSTLEERMLPSGMLEIGHPQAPVAFTLFTHHSCAYCRTFDAMLTDRILTEFVERGRVRLTVVPVPLQKYPESTEQMLLLSCATKQGKGWAMHRALFDGQPSEERLRAMEIDGDALETCTASSDNDRLLPPSTVTLVPSYAINDTLYTGLPEWPELRGQINEALSR